MKQLENQTICAKCGGYCCKKCGCDYFVEDIKSFKIDDLQALLEKGNISIVAALDFNRINGKLTPSATLYLRERNKGKEIVDLLSMKTTCSSLTSTGCTHTFDNRPSGAKHLIPQENMRCYSDIDRLEKLKEWERYQNILSRLVKRLTKKSVNAKLSEDVTNLIYDVMTQKFDGVSKEELYDILRLLPSLHEAFPKETASANARFKKENPIFTLAHK